MRVNRPLVALALAACIGAALVVAGLVVLNRGTSTEVDSLSIATAVPADTDAARATTTAFVGSDLHTLVAIGSRLYVGGHEGVAYSGDGGRTWSPIDSLRGADPMGWAMSGGDLLVGGHPGVAVASAGSESFESFGAPDGAGDVHALGGAGDTVYLASPAAGLFMSGDAGATWRSVNGDVGREFMGAILVDPESADQLVAPDMRRGVVASQDGGRSWRPVGGPAGAASVTWNPSDRRQMVAVGAAGVEATIDGSSWQPINAPAGTNAVTFDEAGTTLYAATHRGTSAVIFASEDGGRTWAARN